jgi:initiation factor 1A
MVKNAGGNKAKKFASKSFTVSNRATRFASEQGEVYAVVQNMYGGNMCEVLCIDGKIRLCVIRGKFSGKGKRDNRLSKGSWVLVGLRDWEITSREKPKTDLLEVYNDGDKEKLIKNSRENFRIFLSINHEDDIIDDDQIKFINDREEEILTEELNQDQSSLLDKIDDNKDDETDKKNKNMSSVLDQLSWVDINDI